MEQLYPDAFKGLALTTGWWMAQGDTLLANPRIGERIDEFEPREVRRILVGQDEMRYEPTETTIYVLRLLTP
ncbi:hypothetical protein [Candidatus Accumulibacter sp. ACC007]|uniref:hypothetical protein n=1 Tax=Candidatus Accumulibacter sp. ACC007 TaxID=2823333 RepID=UPI0025BFEB85|nr:hypothetical protein [Candidatus Accumulibacter sp. ACC007]